MEILLSALLGAAVGALLMWRLPYRRAAGEDAHPASEVATPLHPHATPAQDAESPAAIHMAAVSLAPAYENSAHPQELESHPAFAAGVALLEDPATPLELVIDYCIGANREIAAMAAAALARRDDGEPAVDALVKNLHFAYVWTVFFMLRAIDRHARQPVLCRALLQAPEWWKDNPLLPRMFSAFADARSAKGEEIDLAAELAARAPQSLEDVEAFLVKLDTPVADELRAQVDAWRRTRVDRQVLDSIGRVWASAGDTRAIVEHAAQREAVQAALEAIVDSPPRSVALIGEAGVGKSVVFRSLARALSERGWTIFEAAASDVLAGTTYIGELEARARQLVDAIDVRRHVVWYVPSFHELFHAGRHRFSPTGLLDLLLPSIESGRILVVGETQPAAFDRIVQRRSRLRTALKAVQLEPLALPQALSLVRELAAREGEVFGVAVDTALSGEALELARQHLGSYALPGSVVELLRNALKRAAGAGEAHLKRDHLFDAMTEITGLPRDVVDEGAGLDCDELRQRFAARVMGQPEAIETLVDRVAMLKAGLVDPRRPIGVFMFAGPTGTGKTEAARTLAALLFGAEERMIRLDMSEFQEPASLARILGESGEAVEIDALVTCIRRQPFSVVLLDEFEKAHPRVWDLFLQVFDEGRLSDASGALADFRHAIIIVTSNVGATQHTSSRLGFTTADADFSHSEVIRAIAATFRPEFVNRLDRLVVFRPLSRSVMREILRKELGEVLQRRGFRSREWAVEWEESAIEFLLDKGFTADMGARPLRRAIEAHVLAPIARTIVEHRHPEGDQFLFVRSGGASIEVEFVDPDAPQAAAPPADAGARSLSLAAVLQAPTGDEAERRFLLDQASALAARIQGESWVEQKQKLLDTMNRSEFWDLPERHEVLDRIERMDRIEAAVGTARSLALRIEQGKDLRRVMPRQIVCSLAEQLHLVNAALVDLDENRPSDAYLCVEGVAAIAGRPASPDWPGTLWQMYREWARKRRMRSHVLAEAGHSGFVIAVGGLGAYSLLAAEAGLHVFEVPDEHGGFDRHTARVRVAPQPITPRAAEQDELQRALRQLGAADGGTTRIVRRYRERPSPLVRDTRTGTRTGRLAQVLSGDFDLVG
jgi:ATP-dependent Clp protease ATP-binding subunit ClpC